MMIDITKETSEKCPYLEPFSERKGLLKPLDHVESLNGFITRFVTESTQLALGVTHNRWDLSSTKHVREYQGYS